MQHMVDAFLNRIAETAHRHHLRLRQIAAALREQGLDDTAKKLDVIADEQQSIHKDCITDTQPIN